MNRLSLPLALACGATLSLALVACSAAPGPAAAPSPGSADTTPPADAPGHGAVAGAVEVAEAQLQLVTVSPDGETGLLDLLDGGERTLDRVPAPARVTSDGRYVFADSGSGVAVIDGGAWSWDHGDHFHFYRAEPAHTGIVPGDGPAAITGDALPTTGATGVFFAGSGEAVLLDNAALSTGSVVERFRLTEAPHAGIAAPLGDGALVSHVDERSGATELRVVDASGKPTGEMAACESPRSATTTRAGLVVLCDAGAVVAAGADAGAPAADANADATTDANADADATTDANAEPSTLTFVPLPGGVSASPEALAGRKGRPTLAGVGTGPDGQPGVWQFDARAHAWEWSRSAAELVRAVAVGDDAGHVVALDEQGRARVLRAGEELAHTAPLLDAADLAPKALDALTLTVDSQRAYLNSPSRGIVYEIDYVDSARVARELTPSVRPHFLAEVGL
ncbi:ABC transporter [Leucobacter aridicollis]|uniref:ABC transporter n=1 Tax=Leucobacter aridicollis TaxID=283878 RepID=UPI0031CE09C7